MKISQVGFQKRISRPKALGFLKNRLSERDHVNVKIVQFIAPENHLSEKSVAIKMHARWEMKKTV